MMRASRATIISTGVALLYAACALYRSLHHVFWEDEWMSWLTARASSSIGEAMYGARYDGHPPFWYALQYFITRLTADTTSIKVIHVAIASATVFVIWRYSPFTLLEKILLPLGYFFFFEYSTITRCYAPGVLLATIAAAIFPHSHRRPIAMALVLLCLGQISLYGMVLAMAFAMAVAAQWKWGDRPARWWPAAMVMIAALVLFYFTSRPPPDWQGMGLWINAAQRVHPLSGATRLFDAYLPLPKFTKHWWNTQLIPLGETLRALAGVVLTAIVAYRFRRCRPAIMFFAAGSLAVYAVIVLIYTGSMRHWGHYFIVLVLSVWIARTTCEDRAGEKWFRRAFVVVLAIQAIAGLIAAGFDLSEPFSTAPIAAKAINEIGTALPVTGEFDYALTPLIGELNRPIFFIRRGEYGWFTRFDNRRRKYLTMSMIQRQVRGLALRENSDVVVVMTFGLYMPKEFEFVREIAPGTVGSEMFIIYRYRKPVEQSSDGAADDVR